MFRIVLLAMCFAASIATAAGIDWQEWTVAAFEQADRENKLILVDVGMEGCTACRRMDEVTYTNPRVTELLGEHFVSISVDSEARPDIGERYSDWAWPALIFLAPDTTQVLALRGNRVPKNFIPILDELVARQGSGDLTADKLAPYGAPPEAQTTELTKLRDRLRGQLDGSLNEESGGWGGRGVRTSAGAPLRHLYLRAHMYDQRELRSIALKTTDGYRRAIDPVWGGVFVIVLNDGRVIPEKRISNQANALIAFADAYQLTSDQDYIESLEAVDKYVVNWMMSAEGTFFTSQEDDAPGLPADMNARAYYALDSDRERRRFGVPPIDHAVYTDKNAEVIGAYARVYETTGNVRYLKTAVRAAETLLDERLQPQGWILQTVPTRVVAQDKRMRPHAVQPRPYLSAQAAFGRALLALYRVTGESRWLDSARGIAAALGAQLQDDSVGGFFASPADETATLIPPRKPLEHNAIAAEFLYDLSVYTKDDSLAADAEKALRAVAAPGVLKREGMITGRTALALEKLTAKYVEFSVVGEPGDTAARALFAAARVAYEPRKLLHYEGPGRYPDRGAASMYICNPDVCSLPIQDPDQVAEVARRFRGPAAH